MPTPEDLRELLDDLIANEPDDAALLDHLVRLLDMTWPQWEEAVGGTRGLERLIDKARKGQP